MDQPQKIRVQTAQPFSACLEELAEQFLDEIRNADLFSGIRQRCPFSFRKIV